MFPAAADCLIVNAHVLTMDDEFHAFRRGAVAIQGGQIAAVGPMRKAAGVSAARVIDAGGGIVMPGLVNAHCHAAMTLFRGLADDRPLDAFLRTVWAAEADHVTPGTVEAGAVLGLAEMALGGITYVVDMYFHPAATLAAARHVGMGLTTGPVFIGFDGIDRLPWPDRLRFAEEFVADARGGGGAELMLMPHSTYTLDADQLAEVAGLAGRLGLPVHVHAAEAPSEMRMVAERHGSRPIGMLDAAGMLCPGTLIAHGVHLDDAEIRLIAARGAAVVHCPLSNAKLASGTARIKALRKAGVTVALGTDGASSGNDLDMWQAMRLSAFMQILATGEPDVLPAREVVAMATRGGAAAVGLGRRKGVIAPGMDADVIVVDTSAPHMTPAYDPYSALVYSAGRSDVRHVLIGGRPVVVDGRLVADIGPALEQVGAVAEAIRAGMSA